MAHVMNTLIPNEVGVWIECCSKDCKKWRLSLDFEDPLAVPKKWYCHMNSDPSMNKCSIPESLELEEDEVFVESKFKAGCIVWAKVIGHPWNIAMVDFCPEYKCYYWFDRANTIVPSQYHVTFLAGKHVTRAWVKGAFLKPFVENKDPAFALKARVRCKKITTAQKTIIIQGCRMAQSALRLSLSQRLRKYNFNSYRLAQLLQNQFTTTGKKAQPPKNPTNNGDDLRNVAGPSGTSRTGAGNQEPTRELPRRNQNSNKSHEKLEKAPLSRTNRRSVAKADKESSSEVQKVMQNSKRQRIPCQENPIEAKQTEMQTAKSALAVTGLTDIPITDDSPVLNDTVSMNSLIMENFEEASTTRRRFDTPEKQVVELRLVNGPAVDIPTNNRLSATEIAELMMNDDLDEIIPSSQNSTPRKNSYSKLLLSLNKKTNEKPREEDSDVEIIGEFESVLRTFGNSSHRKISPKLKSSNEEKWKPLNFTSQRSASENSMRTRENKENCLQNSRFVRAFSAFTMGQENPSTNSTDYRRRTIVMRKPPPKWFTDPEQRKIAAIERSERLAKFSAEEDRRIFEDMKTNFFEDRVKAGPSRERRGIKLKAPNYFVTQNYDYLLTSDEDSI